tara:strand:+ start:91 stop:312 length:222 start_codon:yes stop_codon:yes gene_type:complete
MTVKITKQQKRVLDAIIENPNLTLADTARKIEMLPQHFLKYVLAMQKKNFLVYEQSRSIKNLIYITIEGRKNV